jgi:hypothetical protein
MQKSKDELKNEKMGGAKFSKQTIVDTSNRNTDDLGGQE